MGYAQVNYEQVNKINIFIWYLSNLLVIVIINLTKLCLLNKLIKSLIRFINFIVNSFSQLVFLCWRIVLWKVTVMLKEDIFHFLCPSKMTHQKKILYCVDLKIMLTTGLDIFRVQRKFFIDNNNVNYIWYYILYLV